jgi:hypothetical protein
MAKDNPYLLPSGDVGSLVDRLKADRDRAMVQGAETVRAMLSQLREAARAWDEGRSKGRAVAEGTPYWTSINALENWLDGYATERRVSRREARRLQRESQGLVYIAGAGPNTVKIGFTTNMRVRLKGLATGSPAEIEVLAVFPGTTADERELHQRFAKDHLRGEWFRLSAEIAEFIESKKVVPTCGQSG